MNIIANNLISFHSNKNFSRSIPSGSRSTAFYNNFSNHYFNNDVFVSSKKNMPEKSSNTSENETYEYKNLFETRLKSKYNSDLKAKLKFDLTVYDAGRAEKRIKALSKYLKEQMVGYITPDGEHWFEKALSYLIKGSAGIDMSPEIFDKYGVDYAKEFWGLLANADDYWKSEDFLNYLYTNMNQDDPGVKTTIKAVKQLGMSNKVRNSQVAFGYESKMKSVPELLKIGAYSGRPLEPTSKFNSPSLEHILPHSTSGDILNVDSNYLLAGRKVNSDRGSIPLLDFLKGWNAIEYNKFRPGWKSKLKYRLKKDFTIEQRFEKLESTQKENVEKYVRKVLSGNCTKKDLFKLLPEVYDIIVAKVKDKPIDKIKSMEDLKYLLG